MEAKHMERAGWACFVSAVITIPMVILEVMIQFAKKVPEVWGVEAILDLISLFIFIYILHSLRRLLVEQFNFHLAETHIKMMIWINVILVGSSLLADMFVPLRKMTGILYLIGQIVFGIVLIAFGFKLTNLRDPIGGRLKPFCYSSIATGICFASVILLPLALLGSIVMDVLLALIFFRMADRVSANIGQNERRIL
jgi:hypothetical protein